MIQKITTRMLCVLFMVTLASGTLMAQREKTVVGSGKQFSMPNSSAVIPYRDMDDPNVNILIAQNLGPNNTNLYIIDNGWLVTGPTDVTFTGPFSVGVEFTPSVNCHAKILEAAIGYIEGTKRVRLGIYNESGGAVGTLIQDGSTTTIPNFGVCCTLTKVTLSGLGAALTVGTHYFLVATSDAAAPDFGGAWAFVPPAGGATTNGQSFNNINTGFVWDAEWTYYAAYRIQGTNP